MLFGLRAAPSKNKRNKIFTKSALLFFALIFCFSLCAGCALQPSADAQKVLLAMTAAAGSDLLAGDFYTLPNDLSSNAASAQAPDDTPWRIADKALLYAAFGSEAASENDKIFELSQDIVDSGALFLSTAAQPCEYMVFRCVSRSDTDLVVDLLLRRLDAMRRQFRGTEHQPIVESARIVVIGKYVVYAAAPNADDAVGAAEEAVG